MKKQEKEAVKRAQARRKAVQNDQAIECGDAIYLNEIKYSPVASSDLKEYTISNVLICKTDTGMKLYKINEYPDYEYIARYHAWDGEIYKKDETD